MARGVRALAAILAVLALAAAPAWAQKVTARFPYCRCEKAGPFQLAKYVDKIDGNYCFEIEKKPCAASKCCKMDLRKVEWDVMPECRGTTTVVATVNGLKPKQQPSFSAPQDTPVGKAVLKLSALGLNNTAADGTVICLKLTGKCSNLETLCAQPKGQSAGICSISMFNTKDSCCPISSTGWDYPSPPPPPSPRPSPPPRPPPSPPPPARSPPPPSPPSSCPVCISINSTDTPLTREVCDNLATYVNNNWVANSDAEMTSEFTCTTSTPTKVTVCGEVAGSPDAVDLSEFTENTYEIQRLLEELRLSCAFPAMGGSFLVYLVDYGTCRAGFSLSQDCDQPGPNGFPFCECNRRPKATPFALAPIIKVKPGSTSRSSKYCWTATTVTPYDPSSNCGKTNSLYKAEFYVKNNTRGAVTGITVAGNATSAVWDSDGKVFRVTNLGWTKDFVASSSPEICVELTGITLADFCVDANCLYALFDESKGCCPMGTSRLG